MKYTLILHIGLDETHWNIETFDEDRRQYFLELIKKYKTFKGKYFKGGERVEFPDATPELEQILRKECESKNYLYDIGTEVIYSQKDIREAKYVPLCIAGKLGVDMDDYGNEFNKYDDVLCEYCGRTNDKSVPNPYSIYDKRVKSPRDLFGAINGITVISVLAFELLRGELEPWIDCGQVQILDKHRKPVSSEYEYLWIRPKVEVGPFVKARVERTCEKCGQPTEIRKDITYKTFEPVWFVESFKNVNAPIVLAGNWFGEISPKETSNHSRHVFISSDLHEKIRKLKLKGFLKADCIVHAADEMNK